jgi:hypothetical protein
MASRSDITSLGVREIRDVMVASVSWVSMWS